MLGISSVYYGDYIYTIIYVYVVWVVITLWFVRDIVHLGKPSYRERKRIALQQSAAEALGSLNATEINFGGQTYVSTCAPTLLTFMSTSIYTYCIDQR